MTTVSDQLPGSGQIHPTAGESPVWDDGRIEALGPALLTAANAARIGLAVVAVEPPQPRVVYISDVGSEIVGHPRESILSQSALAFLTPEQQEVHGGPIGRDTDRPPDYRNFETTVLTADQRRVPVEVSMAPLVLDGGGMVLIFFRDISDRYRSIEALKRSEERFRKLIELAPDAVWINDGRRLMYVNPATVKMLGYENDAAVLALNPLDIVHPDDHAAMIERSRLMMASGQPMAPREYRTCRRDGSVALTEVQSMPIEWEGKMAILGFARDVSARKEMEAQLIRSDRLAALGTLLAGIAHEMNNPLAYVLLGIEQVCSRVNQLGVPPDDLRGIREVLEEVRQGATRVAAVVDQLRATSRPDMPERWEVVDVGQALRSALRVAGNEIRHRARLVTQLDDIPCIDGSAQRLEQVFLNLLVNATQALPEGRPENEITVRLRVSPGEASSATFEGSVILEVVDNGQGISAEVLPRIFDPFFTTKSVGVGMGLGLSICHGIVTSHGGRIEVESEPGRGTCFRVVLPIRRNIAEAERGDGALPSPPPAARKRRRRILVVDDEPALGTMIHRMLSDDFDVEVVINGRQGLARIQAGADYDTILCDLMMPEMTGMELHGIVCEKHPALAQKFVFMTGGAFTSQASAFLAKVRHARLDKPFEMSALLAAVDGS